MFRLIDTFRFTLERIRQHTMLVGWVLVGLAMATTLALSLTLYVDAVYTSLLDSRLGEPPYASRFRYLGAWNGNISIQDVENTTAAVKQGFNSTIALPVERYARFLRGGMWSLRSETGFAPGSFSFGTLEGADDQMTIIAGQWPPADGELAEGVVPVLVSEAMMFRTGVQVGDEFTAQRAGGGSLTVKIVALWRPTNANDPAWIFTPKFFDEVFLLHSSDLLTALEGIEKPVDEVAWFVSFDGAEVRTADVDGLRTRLANAERDMIAFLPGLRVDLTPQEELTAFSNEVATLQSQLVIIIAPVGGLVLYFVALVAGLLVSRQQPEDVKLRSRGMSRRALLIVHFLMWLLLVGVALGIGLGVAPLLVQLVGRTTSFLRFDAPSQAYDLEFTAQALLIGTVTGLLSASSGLFLAWRTTGQNINSFRQTGARARQAWWQRAYLDILLLIPAVYVLWTLWQSGGLVTNAETPFSDPLTFVGPTVFALALALLFLRLWPIFLGIWGRFMSYTRDIPLMMALRELTRSVGRYRGALLMMSFTLSLTGFTASMASTLDRSLSDTIDYRIGADLVLETAIDPQTEQETDEDGQTTTTVTGYNVPPAEDVDKIPGVSYVSRVGKYTARMTIGAQRADGIVLGMDRSAMAAVTRFREDYAAESLAGLLNQLAGNRTGLLVSRKLAEQYNMALGQEVTLEINALNQWYSARVPVVNVLDYFPTLNPNQGFFALANIEPIWEMSGTSLPHDLWLDLEEGADPEAVKQAIVESGFPVLRFRDPNKALQTAQSEPARRGVLGFLSVGFVAAIGLTLIASIIQSTASFRAQSTQLGALRAMGLGGLSVATYVIVLQGLAAISGILSGTSIGVATTMLFLPLLDFSSGLPPYLVRVAWDEIALVYLVFAGVLFGVTSLTTLILSREQLATIVRLGEG